MISPKLKKQPLQALEPQEFRHLEHLRIWTIIRRILAYVIGFLLFLIIASVFKTEEGDEKEVFMIIAGGFSFIILYFTIFFINRNNLNKFHRRYKKDLIDKYMATCYPNFKHAYYPDRWSEYIYKQHPKTLRNIIKVQESIRGQLLNYPVEYYEYYISTRYHSEFHHLLIIKGLPPKDYENYCKGGEFTLYNNALAKEYKFNLKFQQEENGDLLVKFPKINWFMNTRLFRRINIEKELERLDHQLDHIFQFLQLLQDKLVNDANTKTSN